jgi:hypothetical protein
MAQGTEVVRVMTAIIFVMEKGCKCWRKRVSGGILSSMFYELSDTQFAFAETSAVEVRKRILGHCYGNGYMTP